MKVSKKLVSLSAIFIDCIKTFLWQNFTSVFSRERVFTYILLLRKGRQPSGDIPARSNFSMLLFSLAPVSLS